MILLLSKTHICLFAYFSDLRLPSVSVRENNILQVFETWGPEYKIEFDITVTRFAEATHGVLGLTSVFSFTRKEDDESRIPGTKGWGIPGFHIDNENAQFRIDEQQINNTNYWSPPTLSLPIDLNKKYHFEIQTSLQSMGGPNRYTFKVLVDRELKLEKDFRKSKTPLNAVLYASNDLSPSFDSRFGSLENFTVMR